MTPIVKIKPYNPSKFFHLPTYASKHSAGRDVKACLETPMIIAPHASVIVPTNLCVEFDPYLKKSKRLYNTFFGSHEGPSVFKNTGFELELQIRAKSGLSTKKQLILTNGIGTIDSDYRGELKVALTNVGERATTIDPEESIAQLVLAPILRFEWEETDTLSLTERNEKGFGEQTEIKEG